MKKLLLLAKIIVAGILLFIFVDGLNKMFFHQDDIILLWDMITNFPKGLLETASGHLIILFKPFYYMEWKLFGLNFAGYLAISVILHALVIYTTGLIVFRLTKDKYWQMITLLLLVVNVNFYEIVWMPSSQMMSLSTLFSLLAFLQTLNILDKNRVGFKNFCLLYLLTLLPGLNWGTGLIIPTCLLIGYGWTFNRGKFSLSKVAAPLFFGQVSLIMLYLLLPRNVSGSDVNTPVFNLSNLPKMLEFVFFGISYSIVGRFLFPLASRFFRFITVIIFFSWLVLPSQIKILKKAATQNRQIVLLALTIVFGSYFLIALARFQFGLGQAGAPRYAYLPMMFVVIAVLTLLAKVSLNQGQKKLLLIMAMLSTVLSLGAFTQVTVKWTERPQKNRALFTYLQNLKKSECLKNDFIPWYIVETDKWTLKDIWPLFRKDFDPFTGGKKCIQINRDVPVPWSPVI